MSTPKVSAANKKKNISKAERAKLLEAETAIRGAADGIQCPDHLDEKAQAEFYRVVKELTAINLIGNLDSGALGIYAQCYSNYLQVTLQLRDKDYTGSMEQDRLIKNQMKYVDVILKFAQRFGLTIGDRLKLAAPPEEPEDDEFSDM